MKIITTLCISLLVASSAQATVLTFDIDNLDGSSAIVFPATKSLISVIPDYGDNVNGLTQNNGTYIYNYGMGNGFTPNVTVQYGFAGNAQDQVAYSDGDNVDISTTSLWKDMAWLMDGAPINGETDPTRIFRWTFTPTEPDWKVKVNSFDLFGYGSALGHTFSWTLRADDPNGAILASGPSTSFTPVDDGDPNTLDLNPGSQGAPFTVITGAAPYAGPVVLEIVHLFGSGGAFGIDNLNFDQVPVPEPGSFSLLGIAAIFLARRARRRRLS